MNRIDVLTDEHVVAKHCLAMLSDGVRTVTMPFLLSDYTPPQDAGPALDADRDAVLRDWGITASRGPETLD